MGVAEWHEDGWNTARNLLCVRLDALGDVLMTAPAIRATGGPVVLSRGYPVALGPLP